MIKFRTTQMETSIGDFMYRIGLDRRTPENAPLYSVVRWKKDGPAIPPCMSSLTVDGWVHTLHADSGKTRYLTEQELQTELV